MATLVAVTIILTRPVTGSDLEDADFPGSWPMFGEHTRMKVGGYVKADLLLGKRFRDKRIATKLLISPATVHQHLKQIYKKLGVHGRRQAVEKAASLGILNSAAK